MDPDVLDVGAGQLEDVHDAIRFVLAKAAEAQSNLRSTWTGGTADSGLTKEWADCDEGRISGAGTKFSEFGPTRKTNANTLWSDVTAVFTTGAQDQSPEVAGIVDEDNHKVVEVKNTTEIKPYSEQIVAEATSAASRDFTMTLIIDHRTQINDPAVQALIDSGQIVLIRKELDENDDR